MLNLGPSRIIRMSLLIAGTLFVSACAVSTQPAVTATQSNPTPLGAAQSITNLEWLSEGDETGLRAQFLNELNRSLSARGLSVQSGAQYVADFSVSQREASLGLQPVSSAANASAQEEPDFKGRWYHKCKPNRVSASLVVYARASGEVHTKSTGEFLACPGDLSQLDELAQMLVDRTLSN